MSRQAVAESKPAKAPSFTHALSGFDEGKRIGRANDKPKQTDNQWKPSHDFGRLQASPTQTPAIQPKLKIGAPGDKYEREADRVADQVMRMPDGTVSEVSPPVTPLQTRSVQHDSSSKHASTVTPSIQADIEALQHRGGQPLPESVYSFMEPRFGKELRHVQVHTGSDAAKVSRSLNARALTLGHHIVFNAGQFQPNSSRSHSLLAHELTHVLQQEHTKPDQIQLSPLESKSVSKEVIDEVQTILAELDELSNSIPSDAKEIIEYLHPRIDELLDQRLPSEFEILLRGIQDQLINFEQKLEAYAARNPGGPPSIPGRSNNGGAGLVFGPIASIDAAKTLDQIGRALSAGFGSANAFFQGLSNGLQTASISQAKKRVLRKKILLTSPLFPVFWTGVNAGVGEASFETILSVMNIDQLLAHLDMFIPILLSPEGKDLANVIGEEMAKSIFKDIETLADDDIGQFEFSFEFGRKTGPIIADIVLSIAGFAGAIRNSALIIKTTNLLMRSKRGRRLLERLGVDLKGGSGGAKPRVVTPDTGAESTSIQTPPRVPTQWPKGAPGGKGGKFRKQPPTVSNTPNGAKGSTLPQEPQSINPKKTAQRHQQRGLDAEGPRAEQLGYTPFRKSFKIFDGAKAVGRRLKLWSLKTFDPTGKTAGTILKEIKEKITDEFLRPVISDRFRLMAKEFNNTKPIKGLDSDFKIPDKLDSSSPIDMVLDVGFVGAKNSETLAAMKQIKEWFDAVAPENTTITFFFGVKD